VKFARPLEGGHEAQLLNPLRASDVEVGLLLNFGPEPQVKQLAFDNDRKRSRAAHAAGAQHRAKP
jgi:hypothetical protein